MTFEDQMALVHDYGRLDTGVEAGLSSGVGSKSMTRSAPSALAMRSSVITVGETCPFSSRAIDGWLVPERSASTVWLIPARRRAARTALPTMIDVRVRS